MSSNAAELVLDVEHFRARVLQDALNEATIGYWLGRARDLAKALHRPGDHPGQRTPEQLQEHNVRIFSMLVNVQRHIALLGEQTDISAEVSAALAEAA